MKRRLPRSVSLSEVSLLPNIVTTGKESMQKYAYEHALLSILCQVIMIIIIHKQKYLWIFLHMRDIYLHGIFFKFNKLNWFWLLANTCILNSIAEQTWVTYLVSKYIKKNLKLLIFIYCTIFDTLLSNLIWLYFSYFGIFSPIKAFFNVIYIILFNTKVLKLIGPSNVFLIGGWFGFASK